MNEVDVLLLLLCAYSKEIESSSTVVAPVDFVRHVANRREEQGATASHHHQEHPQDSRAQPSCHGQATGPRNGKLERLAGERLVGEEGGGGEVDTGGEDVEEEQGLERPQPGAAARGAAACSTGRRRQELRSATRGGGAGWPTTRGWGSGARNQR